jgi:hypothetical protein
MSVIVGLTACGQQESRAARENLMIALLKRGILSLVISAMAVPVAQAAPIVVNFEVNTATPTVGSFTFDSALDGSILSYADLDAFSITLWSGSTYDLAFVTGGPFSFNEFAFDTTSDSFLDLSADSGIISAITLGLSDGFWISAPGDLCAGGRCVADYPGAVFENFTTLSAARVAAVPEPSTIALSLSGWAAFVYARRKRRAA